MKYLAGSLMLALTLLGSGVQGWAREVRGDTLNSRLPVGLVAGALEHHGIAVEARSRGHHRVLPVGLLPAEAASGIELRGVPVSRVRSLDATPAGPASKVLGVEVAGMPTGLLPMHATGQGSVRSTGAGLIRATAPVLGISADHISGPNYPAGVLEVEPLVEDLLRASNATRRLNGAGTLVTDPGLRRAAARYARELARREEIEHHSPTPGLRTFRDRISREGVRAQVGGENLARLSASTETLGERTVQAWLRSPGHRFNLLDPIFTRTGIGVWLGADGIWYLVQLYATAS